MKEDNRVRIMEWEEEISMYEQLIASSSLSNEEVMAANFAIGFGLGQIKQLREGN